jgi:hypothetical protein
MIDIKFGFNWLFDKLGYMPKIDMQVGKVDLDLEGTWPFPKTKPAVKKKPQVKKVTTRPTKKKPAVTAKTARTKKK